MLPGHEAAQACRHLDLAAMAAQRVNAGIERRVGAFGGVGRERAGDQRGAKHALDREQSGERFRQRELGAVEQREAFLGPERDRLEPGMLERGCRRHAFAGEIGLADSEHGRRHVRERREIAGGADRPLARDHRDHGARQHGFEHGERARPHAGGAAAEARELERHHQAHVCRLHRRRRRRRHARARYCAEAPRDRAPRCARSRAFRNRY